jgi:hypothetical protein
MSSQKVSYLKTRQRQRLIQFKKFAPCGQSVDLFVFENTRWLVCAFLEAAARIGIARSESSSLCCSVSFRFRRDSPSGRSRQRQAETLVRTPLLRPQPRPRAGLYCQKEAVSDRQYH